METWPLHELEVPRLDEKIDLAVTPRLEDIMAPIQRRLPEVERGALPRLAAPAA